MSSTAPQLRVITSIAEFRIKGLGILAETSLMLWLVVMGVSERRWQEQAVKREPQ